MQDEGFHEIQLNGKQLVFLFMSATVVAVVVFLCGVMVGRGVAVPRTVAAADIAEQAILDPTAAATAANTGNESLTAGEELTYAGRLEDPTPPAEDTETRDEAALPAAPRSGCACTRAGYRAGASPLPDPALTEPAGQGICRSGRRRAEACGGRNDRATTEHQGVSNVRHCRWRQLPRACRQMQRPATAQSIAGRLEREERFKPWITR